MPAARRSPRGEARRTQILEGALAAIRGQAIADVPLASIAAHAGLSASHVLYYFASRDDVLVAAVAHAEATLAASRNERLRAITDPEKRLREYIRAYLPVDAHDPVWKLWIEGWLRSAAREQFAPVGSEAALSWRVDLVEVLRYVMGSRAPDTDELTALARRFTFLLDGIAVHVLAGHLNVEEAAETAMRAIQPELG